jgi:apolipoprotein N-acyltransferase
LVQGFTFSQKQIMTMWPWLVSVLAGVLHGFSMAWPAVLGGDALQISGQASGFLQCLSLAMLAALLLRLAASDGPQKRLWLKAFWLSGLFATSAMVATWGWLYVSMHRYGGLPAWLSVAAVLLLAMALSVYFAVAGGLWVALFRRWILSDRDNEARYAKQAAGLTWDVLRQGLAGVALFAALWTMAELSRGQLFTGFPWGAAGYAHTDSWLATYLPWVGVYGLGAVAAGIGMAVPVTVAMLMAQRTHAWRWLALATFGMSVFLPWALQTSGSSFSESAGGMTVRLLQGNIPQDEKFIPGQGVKLAIQWYSEQLLGSTEALVVTPETAVPVLPQQLPRMYWQALQDKFSPAQATQNASPPASLQAPQMALIGVPLGGAGAGFSNSVVAIGPQNAMGPAADAVQQNWLYRYDKQHLVPFGEFVPPFFQWFVRMMNMPLGDFAHDRPAPSVLSWQGQRLLPQICYEDLFGEEVAQYFVNTAEAPTVLVNMSNLAWFGDTTAAPQHLAISRIRALEFQRPIIRATNTGATAWVDHKGVVRAALPALTRGALVFEFEGRKGLTPYAQWTSRWGLAPLWFLCAAIVLVFGFFSRRSGDRAL